MPVRRTLGLGQSAVELRYQLTAKMRADELMPARLEGKRSGRISAISQLAIELELVKPRPRPRAQRVGAGDMTARQLQMHSGRAPDHPRLESCSVRK
jgi:hypothetical protein